MQTKTIGLTSASLLAGLHEQSLDFFNIQQAAAVLSDHNEPAVRRLLADMTHRGLLMRLREGLYHIVPYDRDPSAYFPDWHVAAHFLAGQTPYYIGYFSALVFHDLTTQPSLMEQVVVSKPLRPTQQRVGDVTFQFVLHKPQRFFGATRRWIQGIYPVQCSDLEKTLLDCAYRPDYGGGIAELAKAIYKARNDIRPEQLLHYTERFGADAPIRRLGFLLEAMDILPVLARDLQAQLRKSATYVALDTSLPKSGRTLSRWGIVQNIDLQTIQTAALT
jgi:predicted transcriptional regulator of viral defense system